MTSRKAEENGKVVDNLFSTASALDITGASGFILGSIKSISSIRDRVYISKFKKFWLAVEENKIEVGEFIKKTEKQKDWQKVGENFLLVMDSFSTFDKCYYYGKVWISWLKEEIDTNEFIEITNILQSIFITDLQHILYHSKDKNFTYLDEDRLYNCGFLKRGDLEELESAISRSVDFYDHKAYKPALQQREENIDNVLWHLKFQLLNPYTESNSGKKLTSILTQK